MLHKKVVVLSVAVHMCPNVLDEGQNEKNKVKLSIMLCLGWVVFNA